MFTLILLYSLIVLMLFIGAAFIVYHILRYSLSDVFRYLGAMVFGFVFLALLSINFFSFQTVRSVSDFPLLETAPLMDTAVPPLLPSQTKSNPW